MGKYTIRGFRFSGVVAGIKKNKKPDVMLIASDVPAVVAGTFTTNKVQAAPVLISKKNIRSGFCRAIVANSGNANACTGKRGWQDAQAMVHATARGLKIPDHHVLVCSTGKIGVSMPMPIVKKGIARALKELSPQKFSDAAEAILTTDAAAKIASAAGKIGGSTYRIAAFAKGAGMIEPHMKGLHATMLAFVMTDAAIGRAALQSVFEKAVDRTFNVVTVDGDTSTNDTALILANGFAKNKPLRLGSAAMKGFEKNLVSVLDDLARQMVKDGEGATKCVAIDICGAKSDAEARQMAYATANSLLVKTSFYGEDPNWGRVMGAIGRSGANFDPDRVSVFYGDVCVFRQGLSTGAAADARAKRAMKHPEFTVTVDCRQGRGRFRVYASDLTLDYVKINSHYRT
jgi:glutamate N-acetyltransferase/amino-acid N-acetyltransferase